MCIQPVGKINMEIVEFTRKMIELLLGRCKIISQIEIDPGAYDPQRRQYKAEKLLNQIDKSCPVTLGITEVDLYAPSLNFVFGQAELGGKRAIISTKRLKPEFYGFPHDEKLFRERIIKEAMHEIGHVLGLPHCPNPLCVMYFSNSIEDTDRKDWRYCPSCSSKLKIMRVNFRG